MLYYGLHVSDSWFVRFCIWFAVPMLIIYTYVLKSSRLTGFQARQFFHLTYLLWHLWPFSRTKVAMSFLRCIVDMTLNLSQTVGITWSSHFWVPWLSAIDQRHSYGPDLLTRPSTLFTGLIQFLHIIAWTAALFVPCSAYNKDSIFGAERWGC
jgi:hypothetical protein